MPVDLLVKSLVSSLTILCCLESVHSFRRVCSLFVITPPEDLMMVDEFCSVSGVIHRAWSALHGCLT